MEIDNKNSGDWEIKRGLETSSLANSKSDGVAKLPKLQKPFSTGNLLPQSYPFLKGKILQRWPRFLNGSVRMISWLA